MCVTLDLRCFGTSDGLRKESLCHDQTVIFYQSQFICQNDLLPEEYFYHPGFIHSKEDSNLKRGTRLSL